MVFLAIFANALALADSRETFVEDVLPDKYPQLISYLRANGTLPVFWTSQTEEQQSLTVEMTVRDSVLVTTMGHTGPATNMNTPTMIIMIDRDLDSRLRKS